MSPTRHLASPTLALVAAAVLTVVLGACTAVAPDGPVPPAPSPGATPAADPDPASDDDEAVAAVLSWEADTAEVALPDGHRIARCEGDAPLWCVERDGDVLGVVELLRYPREGADDLAARVADLHTTVREDREITCGDGWAYAADPVAAGSIGGHAGVRSGFTTTSPEGLVDERTVVWMALTEAEVLVVNAAAYRPGGCPGPGEGLQELAPEALEAVLPALADLVAASPVPAVTS